MKRLLTCLLMLVIGLMSYPMGFGAQTRNQRIDPLRFLHSRYHPSRLIVKRKGQPRPLAIALRNGQDVLEELSNLQYDDEVEYAEPDLIYTVDRMVPNDPDFGSLWGMETINAPEAWSITSGTEDVVVAIIDTGVDYKHPDLADNIWVNAQETPGNLKDDDGNGYIDDYYGLNAILPISPPDDDNKHGTHIAGIIGAVGNNDLGVVGVNWQVKIMALKFLDKDGSGYLSDALEAIDYIIMMKRRGVNIRVVNASWGANTYSKALEDAALRLRNEGILFVAAAGNDGKSDRVYPGAYDTVLSVAAIEQGGNLAYFSNFGDWVDVAAPGRGILSTIPGGSYASYSGTSMATPHVSGLAALALAARQVPVDELEQAIRSGVSAHPSLKDKVSTGGIIDAAETLRHITSGQACQGNCPPVVSLSASSLVVDNGGTVTFTASASDPEGDPLSFSWATTAGRLTEQITSATLETTDVNPTPGSSPVTVVVTVTANDGQGNTSSASRSISVRSPNRPPQVSVEAGATSVQDGSYVSLTAQGSDPDGDDLTYTWTSSAGRIIGSGSVVYLDASNVNPTPDSDPVTVTVTVSVSDSRGGTATASQQITVISPPKISISTYPTSVKFVNGKATFYLTVRKHKSYSGGVQLRLLAADKASDLEATITSGFYFWLFTHRVVVTLKSSSLGTQRYEVFVRGTTDDGKTYDSNEVALVKN